jgi:SpoIID/LytB domain protein
MRKTLILLLFASILFLVGCMETKRQPEVCKFSGPTKVEVDRVIKLEVDITDELNWLSDNNEVATVENGYVYGHQVGKAIISVYKLNSLEKYASILINVLPFSWTNEKNLIITGGHQVYRNESITLEVNPTIPVVWESKDEEIATITNGVVFGKRVGAVKIKATDVDNPLNYGFFEVKVSEAPLVITGPTTTILRNSITLNTDSSSPIMWTSSNEDIATVIDGVITSLQVGTVTIKAEVIGNSLKYGTYTITVTKPLGEIDTEYLYYKTKILSINELGYQMELLDVPSTNLTAESEFLKWNGSEIETITIDDIYIGLENVYVAVGKQSNTIKKVLINREIGFRNIRVAIRRSINDIANDNTLYHYSTTLIMHNDTSLQTYDGLFKTTIVKDSTVEVNVVNDKMVVSVKGAVVLETNKRIIFNPGYSSILFQSIYRSSGKPNYNGNLELSLVKGRLLVVNDLDIESYLTKVVPSEMSASWPIEALKSQAIAARTYAYMDILNKSNDKFGYTVDDSIKSQVYNNNEADYRSNEAIEATKGLIMTSEGKPIQAYYYSTSSGITASGHEVWIKDKTIEPIPYLIGQNLTSDANGNKLSFDYKDEESMLNFFKTIKMYTPDKESPYHRWKVTMTFEQLTKTIDTNIGITYASSPESVLTKEGNDWVSKAIPSSIGNIINIYVDERGASGVVISLIIKTSKGTYKIVNQYNIRFTIRPKDAGTSISRNHASNTDTTYTATKRNDSTLLSGFFAIEINSDTVYFYGGGNGHGVGMSQYGAYGLAKEGKTYLEILETYYSSIDLTDITYDNQALDNYIDLLR